MKITRWVTKEKVEDFTNRDTTFADFMESSLPNGRRQYGEDYNYKIEITIDDIKEQQ